MNTGEIIARDAAPSAPPTTRVAHPGLRELPAVDPARSNDEVWIGAARFLGRTDGATIPGPMDARAIEAARSMSHRAADLSARAAKASGDAASLRREAAEGKRLAGVPAEAFEDYEALTRHHLADGGLKSAVAYMRKALHVSDMSEDVEIRMGARLLAAKTYLAVRKPESALEMAGAAKAIAESAGLSQGKADAVALLEAAKWTPTLRDGRCACGKGIDYGRCCGAGDTVPVEFSEEVRSLLGEVAPGTRRPGGWRAMETLMRPPQGTESLTWYAWFVEDGCHRLVAYPNWSGRALRAAEAMAGIARERKCAEAASSAVLQSFVAIESFLTSWKSLARMDVVEEGDPPKEAKSEGKRNGRGKNDSQSRLVGGWAKAMNAMFGAGCSMPDRPGFEKLAELRNELVHSAAVPEIVIPRSAQPNRLVSYFEEAGFEIGPAPAPWIDRIMTPDVADWAVRVAKAQISAVREAWDAADCARENRDWWLGFAQDADDEVEDDPLQSATDSPPAQSPRHASTGTSLGHLAKRASNSVGGVEDEQDGNP